MVWTAPINQLLDAVVSLRSAGEARRFLRDLMTESELREFAARWQAARLLDSGVPYRTIERRTGLSSATVARVNRWLRGPLGGYRSAISKLHRHASPPAGRGLR